MSNPSPKQATATPGDPAAALHGQIELEKRCMEQLRGIRQYQADLLRRYSKAHGFCVPLTVDQFLEHSRRAA